MQPFQDRRLRRSAACPAVALLCLAACAPELDWRLSRPQGSGAELVFPCRPEGAERSVRLADAEVRMHVHTCRAAGGAYTLAYADAGDPSQVATLLAAWRRSAGTNIGGAETTLPMPAVAGATPNARSARLRVEGRLPDGRSVELNALFVVRGTRVFEASTIAAPAQIAADALDTFFAAIRLA